MAVDRGQWNAVEGLYADYGALVFRACRAILHSHDDAEEASQEVFAKLLASGCPADVRDRRRWLLEVTRNHCIDRLRAASRRPSVGGVDVEVHAAQGDAEEQATARAHLRWLLSRLTSGQREVVVRHAVLDEPLDTVASQLGLSYGAAAQLLYRARLVLARTAGAGNAVVILLTRPGRRLRNAWRRASSTCRLRAGSHPPDPALGLPVAALLIAMGMGTATVSPSSVRPGTPPPRHDVAVPVAARAGVAPGRAAMVAVEHRQAVAVVAAKPAPSLAPQNAPARSPAPVSTCNRVRDLSVCLGRPSVAGPSLSFLGDGTLPSG